MGNRLIYGVPTLPDITDPSVQMRAQGDPSGAIEADAGLILRTLAAFDPGSASLALRFYYRPAGRGIGSWERLRLFVMGQSHKDSAVLRLLLEGGPLKRFHSLQPISECPVDWHPFKAACDIVRRQMIVPATITGEFNARALTGYFTLISFEPRRNRDDLRLDAVLDRLECPVLIEMCVEPVGSSDVVQRHLAYIAHLQLINRSWDSDEEIPVKSWFAATESGASPPPLRRRDPLVDSILRTEQRNHEALLEPQLTFHLRVFAPEADTATLVASVLADSAFAGGSYQLVTTKAGDPWFKRLSLDRETLRVVPLPISECLLTDWQDPRFRQLAPLGTMAPADELLGAVKLPHASFGTTRCIATSTDPPVADEQKSIILGQDARLDQSRVLEDAPGLARGLLVRNLAKGVFISGIPGQGKTMAVFSLLMQLFARGIPFIVLESGNKRDYRVLKCLKDCTDKALRGLARELRIYTPGLDGIAPMRLNPLHRWEGVSTNEWIENIVGCFQGAMPMFEPLPELLAQSLEWVYDKQRGGKSPPTMMDLFNAARLILRDKNYSSEVASNLGAAIETRLGNLTRRLARAIFQCHRSMPTIDELMNGYSVIELASLTPERTSLLSLFLLTCINAQIKSTADPDKPIRMVIILEEAHNLVGRNHDTAGTGENEVDPKKHASDLICRMLAEYRSLGVSLVIVDQLASAVAPEVVKQTGTKIAFLQADGQERETITAAMASGAMEEVLIGKLFPGLCLFHTEGGYRARLIRTRNLQEEFNIPAPPAGQAILPYLRDDKWFRSATDAWQRDDLDRLEGALESLDDHRTAVFNETKALLTKASKLIESRASFRREDLAPIANRARRLQAKLDKALVSFQSECRPWLLDGHAGIVAHKAHDARRERLLKRFLSAVEPGVKACLEILKRLADGTHNVYSILPGGDK